MASRYSDSYLLTAFRKSPTASGGFDKAFINGSLSNYAMVFFGVSGAFNFRARFALSILFLTSSFERP